MSMLYKLDSTVQEDEDDNNVTFRLYGTNAMVKEALTNTDTNDNTTTVIVGYKSPDSTDIDKNTTKIISINDETSPTSSSSVNCNDHNYEVNFDTTVSASVVLSKKRTISSSKVTDGDHVQTSY
ncbi:unnamed protein product, partial [Acanthocheilonema viteae]